MHLLTFTRGVALATCWFFYSKPVLIRNLLARFLLQNATLIKNIPEPSESCLKGKSEAEKDISKSKLKVVTLGTEMLRQNVYREILLKEYGIEVNNLRCLISDKEREFADGYNQMAEVTIEQQYGKGVLKEVTQRADEENNRFSKYLEGNKQELEKKISAKE